MLLAIRMAALDWFPRTISRIAAIVSDANTFRGTREGNVENVWLWDVHMSTHLMMLAWGRMRTSMNAEQHGYVHRKKHSVLERPPRATEKSGTLLHPILTVTVSCASGNVGVNVPQEQFPTWPPMPVSSGARHFLMASAGVGSAAHTEAT